ncbi:hypothetical protein SAMN04487996_1043 [Dyadobacter soli]|uniref:Uncharacterized protein n=1 Tax=Dyadobacter soli TaxID=659014 RepID=A0A1G7AXF3_9BACT|nr:hypothetical protein [Dyadobacter soli]SDE19473.1 hypothetical protein SAMN04487996_1043 [Dyadobacter soli]
MNPYLNTALVSQTPEVKVQEVIVSRLTRRGDGDNQADPVRTVFQIFDLEGNLLAERDEYSSFSKEQLLHFAKFVKEMELNDVERAFASWVDSINGG